MPVKPELDAVVHSPRFHNYEIAIVYCHICSTPGAIPEKFLVLHILQYRAQLSCTPKLHELQY